LVIGVAPQAVIDSLVSGMALPLNSERNAGDYIEWPDCEGIVQSATRRPPVSSHGTVNS